MSNSPIFSVDYCKGHCLPVYSSNEDRPVIDTRSNDKRTIAQVSFNGKRITKEFARPYLEEDLRSFINASVEELNK